MCARTPDDQLKSDVDQLVNAVVGQMVELGQSTAEFGQPQIEVIDIPRIRIKLPRKGLLELLTGLFKVDLSRSKVSFRLTGTEDAPGSEIDMHDDGSCLIIEYAVE